MTAPNRLKIDNFLDLAVNRSLLNLAIAQETNFVESTVSTSVAGCRRSKVLYEFGEFSVILEAKIRALFLGVLGNLALDPFPISQIEAQLTAHNHGDYFKIHNDNGCPNTNSRRLTYVYYFNSLPQAFEGGELQIGDARIAPVNNRIVFFPSDVLHQVLPINCPFFAFAHSRFTLNGWIRSSQT